MYIISKINPSRVMAGCKKKNCLLHCHHKIEVYLFIHTFIFSHSLGDAFRKETKAGLVYPG